MEKYTKINLNENQPPGVSFIYNLQKCPKILTNFLEIAVFLQVNHILPHHHVLCNVLIDR